MDESEEKDVGGRLLPVIEHRGPAVTVILKSLLGVVGEKDVETKDLEKRRQRSVPSDRINVYLRLFGLTLLGQVR